MTLSSLLFTYISLSDAVSSLITRERCNLRNGAGGQGEEKAREGSRNQARFLGTKEYRKRKDVYCGLSGLCSFVGSPIEPSRAGERHDRESPEGKCHTGRPPCGQLARPSHTPWINCKEHWEVQEVMDSWWVPSVSASSTYLTYYTCPLTSFGSPESSFLWIHRVKSVVSQQIPNSAKWINC